MEIFDYSHIHTPQAQGTGISNTLLILGGYLYPQLRDSRGEEKQSVADRFIELLGNLPHGPGTSIGKILDQYSRCPQGEFRAHQLQKVVGDFIREAFPNYPN